MTSFKDREEELVITNNCIESNKFEFMLTYGRRRVGKTELHLHATRNLKVVYYLSRKSRNLENFKQQCVKIVPQAEIVKLDYEALFEFLKDKVDAIIIDEFPELVREDENILNIFQYISDIILKNTQMKLFLLGSSISIMKSQVLSTPSPLYGRKTISLHLQPFNFYVLKEFFPSTDLEEIIEIYGFSGGIPYYLNQIEPPFWKWLKTELTQQTFVRDEAEFLLRYEFFTSGRYYSILEAIAFGYIQLTPIAQYTSIPITSLPQYLASLDDVGFIKREIPITERKSSKRGQYILSDNFLRFYFRFIYPNLESLDRKILDVQNIKSHYSEYMGKIFEEVVAQFIVKFRNKLKEILNTEDLESKEFFNFTKIGRWWWKDVEIDHIGLNPDTDKSILIECKWQENVDGSELASKLFSKIKRIRYKGKFKQKQHLILIFAKKFREGTRIN
ncbi:MAG: AAA family ATPase, partial [Candidatus Lokiarchaeota archaeon]|nr:AAA family ATPase [Candidatus Lokiarchaeota archaeon]MBD3201776.1 AAA family ATPase [Candidatus Lokiarchaeota archaeon]